MDLLPGRWFLETSVLIVLLLEAAPGAAGLGGAAPPCWKLPIFLLRSQEDGEARRRSGLCDSSQTRRGVTVACHILGELPPL